MTTVISVENLSKTYHLGQIGTGTFANGFRVWWAKMHGRPNPLLKIGEADHGNRDGKELWALLDGSFIVAVIKGSIIFNCIEQTFMDMSKVISVIYFSKTCFIISDKNK